MSVLYSILVAIHVLCWIGALVLTDPIGSTIRKGAFHAIAAALVVGVVLVGIGEAADLRDYDHAKIAIKFVVAAVATVLAFVAERKPQPTPLARAVFALVTANILIAVLW